MTITQNIPVNPQLNLSLTKGVLGAWKWCVYEKNLKHITYKYEEWVKLSLDS